MEVAKAKEELVKVRKKARKKAMEDTRPRWTSWQRKLGRWRSSICRRNSTLTIANLVRRPSIKASNWVRMLMCSGHGLVPRTELLLPGQVR